MGGAGTRTRLSGGARASLPIHVTSSTPTQSMQGDSPCREVEGNDNHGRNCIASSEGTGVSSDATQSLDEESEAEDNLVTPTAARRLSINFSMTSRVARLGREEQESKQEKPSHWRAGKDNRRDNYTMTSPRW